MKKLFIGLLFLFSTQAKADFNHQDLVQLTAHVGASYAIHTTLYGVNSRLLEMDPIQAHAVAALETLAIGVLYKIAEGQDGIRQIPIASAKNALGIAGAVLTCVTFSF